MYLIEADRRLGPMRACTWHFGREDVMAGSVDAFSFVVSGVLLAPDREECTLRITFTCAPIPAGSAHIRYTDIHSYRNQYECDTLVSIQVSIFVAQLDQVHHGTAEANTEHTDHQTKLQTS